MSLDMRIMVLAGALAATGGVEGCEKNEQYSSSSAQEEKKVDKANNAEDISKRLSAVTEREFIDLYVDVSNRQPELLGLFYESGWTNRDISLMGMGGEGLLIKDYNVIESGNFPGRYSWRGVTEKQKADGRSITVEMALKGRHDPKDGFTIIPFTRKFYIETTKIDGKRKIMSVGW